MIKVILSLLVIFAFYATRLQDVITYDEVYTFYAYSYNPLVALVQYTLPNNHQLHSVIVWFSTSLIGDSVIAIRLPVLFASMLTLSMLYQIAKRFYTSYVAWLLLILLAIYPLYIQYSLESRGYMLSNLLLLLLISRIYQRNLWSKRNSYLILILCSALMITLPTMIIAIVGCIVWGMTIHHKKVYRRFVISPAITGCIVGGMFYIAPLVQGLFSDFSQMFGYKSVFAFVEVFVYAFILASPSAVIAFILLLVGLLTYRTVTKRPFQLFGILILITVLVLSIQFVVSGSLIFPRNLIFFLPIWTLTLGSILQNLLGWGADNRWVTMGVILYLLCNLFLGISPQPSETDHLLEDISQYANESDYLVFACCQDGPIRYELEHREQIHLIDRRKDYERVVIFSFNRSVEDVIKRYELDVVLDNCYLENWNRFDPYICEVKSILK